MASPKPAANLPSPSSSTASVGAAWEPPSAPPATPSLEQLVAHFVASKRSLACISHVWRANEIVNAARAALEDNAALAAKNAFLQRAVERQVASLDAVREGVEKVGMEGQAEFKSILHSLDAASARLQSTINVLRTTIVPPSLQSHKPAPCSNAAPPSTATGDVEPPSPKGSPSPSSPPQEQSPSRSSSPALQEPKRLYDFVDSSIVDSLNAALRSCIDRTNDAAAALAAASDAFDAALDEVATALNALPTNSNNNLQRAKAGDEEDKGAGATATATTPVPQLLRELEAHAREMADLLQGLVRHYDVCVTALKHTEGGGEAAAALAADAAGVDAAAAAAEVPPGLQSLDAPPRGGPLTDEERADLLAVLDKDAGEVEDVVGEIRERGADMEARCGLIEEHVGLLREESRGLNKVLKLLDKVGGRCGEEFIGAAATFARSWEDEKRAIAEKMEEVEALRCFYEGFSAAFDGLILEVARRKGVRTKVEKIVAEAMGRVERLLQEDQDDRKAFRTEHGEYLPSDIWPGLVNPPTRYELRPVNPGVADIPDINREALEQVKKRMQARVAL
ncbi:putative kinase activator [Lineolata rhizophorae]|uniref:Autophagy-related protein 17 n=1 Tax=Lineolata rhizophorae TaxID=578093 RepID=A0A6A6NQV2_9PEZI|nr:putative kinase activator [Lineolata rhizophorae]